MKVATIGRGKVGGGLARLWRAAGHEVEEIGRDGGDVAGADAVLLAVPAPAIEDAMARMSGFGDVPLIDATNLVGREAGGLRLGRRVREVTDGRSGCEGVQRELRRALRPAGRGAGDAEHGYAADEEARAVTAQLIRDGLRARLRRRPLRGARGGGLRRRHLRGHAGRHEQVRVPLRAARVAVRRWAGSKKSARPHGHAVPERLPSGCQACCPLRGERGGAETGERRARTLRMSSPDPCRREGMCSWRSGRFAVL